MEYLSGGLHLNDINTLSDSLQKENFDLKMQIFYLNQKRIAEESNNNNDNNNNNKLIDQSSPYHNKNQNNNDNITIIESRRLHDLETEIQMMKLNNMKIERELAAERSMLNSSNTSNKSISLSSISARVLSASKIEENRQIEREAVLAIAEHDAAIISKLENEVRTLKVQHEMDIALINECADRSNELIRENNEKSSILFEQQENQQKLQDQIDYLATQLKRQELIIEKAYISQKVDETTINKDVNSSPMSFSWLSKQNLGGSPSGNSLPPAISKKDIFGSPGSLNSQKLPMTPPPTSNSNMKSTVTSRDFLDFGAQAAWEELHSLRKENTSLKEQLERERKFLNNQEAVLSAVKQAAEEISLLEAEEITRLEGELERVTDERDKWMKTARESDNKVNTLRQRLVNLDKSRLDNETNGLSLEVENAFNRNSSRLSMNQSMNQSRLSLNGSFNNSMRSTTNMSLKPNIDLYQQREDMFKQREVMYKEREKELLEALEQVVLRCSELEKQLFLAQKKAKMR